MKSLEDVERTAENVVDKARDPSSEIHDLFIWNDKVAAEEYRKEQARLLMRSVSIRIIHEDGDIVRPAFFSVAIEKEPSRALSYVRYSFVSEDEETKRRVLAQAHRDLEAFKTKYGKYEDIFRSTANTALVEILRLADEALFDDGLSA